MGHKQTVSVVGLGLVSTKGADLDYAAVSTNSCFSDRDVCSRGGRGLSVGEAGLCGECGPQFRPLL